MVSTVFVVTAPYVHYNDQTYDVNSSTAVVYAGTSETLALATLDDSTRKLAASWEIDDFSPATRRGLTSVEDVIRAAHGFFSQQLDFEQGPFRLVFGPGKPELDEWGELLSCGVECWGVVNAAQVLEVVAARRDEFVRLYEALFADYPAVPEGATAELLSSVSTTNIEFGAVECEG